MIYDHFTYYFVDLARKGEGVSLFAKKIVCRGGGGPTCYVTLDKIWKMIFERFPDFAPEKYISLSGFLSDHVLFAIGDHLLVFPLFCRTFYHEPPFSW